MYISLSIEKLQASNSACGRRTFVFMFFCFVSGFLTSVDAYMNVQLENAEEWMDGACAGQLGEVLIRYVWVCDGVQGFCKRLLGTVFQNADRLLVEFAYA